MIDILCNCFNSLHFYLILFIGFILYLINKKSREKEFNKLEQEKVIESIPRRSEECPQQYPNGWLPVCDSNDLKKGEVKPIFALGRDLVIYRGISSKVYIFDAYCPHLGANLGVGGTVVGDDIKCHFHGWQFNNQGDCKSIPGLEDKSIPKASIRKWRCDEVNDFIYVWHHLDGNEPDWFMPKLEKFENFIYTGKFTKTTYCHIQDIAENEADLVHLDTVHGFETLVPKFLQNIIKTKIKFIFWKVCEPPDTHRSNVEVEMDLKIGAFTPVRALVVLHSNGPANFTIDFHLDIGIKLNFVMNSNVITLGHLKQLFVMKVYSEPSILSFILVRAITSVFDYTIEPDVPIWNTKKYQRSPQFTKLDETIVHFRQWFKQFYSNHSKVN